jgi:hypothetical protein
MKTLLLGCIFFCLSYKTKAPDEPAIRLFYTLGIPLAIMWVVYQLMIFRSKIRFKRSLLIFQVPLLGYVFLAIYGLSSAYFLYPSSFRAACYVFITPMVVLALLTSLSMTHSVQRTLGLIFRAMFAFSMLNLIFEFINRASQSLEFSPISQTTDIYGIHPVGLVGDPTSFGALFGVTFLLYNFLYFKKSRLIIFLLIAGVLWSGSRNVVLCCTAGILVTFFISESGVNRQRGFFRRPSASNVLLVVLAGLGFNFFLGLDYLLSLFKFGDPNAFNRIDIWLLAIDVAGKSSLSDILFGGHGGVLATNNVLGAPFNGYLRLLLNHGAFFLFSFVLIIICVLFLNFSDVNCRFRRLHVSLSMFSTLFAFSSDTLYPDFFHFAEFPLLIVISHLFASSSVRTYITAARGL